VALGAYGFVATLQETHISAGSSPRTAGSSSPARWRGAWRWTGSGPTGSTTPERRSVWSVWR
jgi:hypothetical protein